MLDTSNARKNFGQRLKEVRHKRGYSMDVISKKIGVARSTYAGYETQERFPPIEVLARIGDELHTSIDYLIGLTDDPQPHDVPHNVVEYLTNSTALHWNGIPLSDDDIKPIKDLFEIIIRERLPKIKEETSEEVDGAK